MPAVTITPDDLAPFATIELAKAAALIEDAMARAARIAPCLLDPELDATSAAAAKGIIRDAILRRNESGAGAVHQQTAGPFSMSMDTRQTRKVMFWPSEVEELQAICADHNGVSSSGAFSVDTAPSTGSAHLPWCALMFGAVYCSCGVDIAGEPIFELG